MPRDRRGDFGTYMGIHREHAHKTQTQIAAACGVTQCVISDWETGKDTPDTEAQARTIAGELGIDQDLLASIWRGDVLDRARKGDLIITRSYATTSKGGGSTEDPYPHPAPAKGQAT